MGTATLSSPSLSIEPVNLFGVDSHNSLVRLAALESEGSLQAVSMEDQQRREQLVKQIRMLPRDALQTMRHFQTQVGCLNRCSFCSQSAGTTLWNMSQKDLANLVAALKTVGLEWAREDNAVCAEPLSTTGVFSRNFVMPIHGLIGNNDNCQTSCRVS